MTRCHRVRRKQRLLINSILIVVVLSLTGGFSCGGQAEEKDDDTNDSPLGVSVADALKEDCPNGGVVINQGIDTNRNGKIDTAEISSSDTVCNGKDGTDNRIIGNIICTGQLGTDPFVFVYTFSVMASGDVFATANIAGSAYQIGSTAFYSSQQNGAATAAVGFLYDALGSANGGWWSVSINTSTLVVTVVYHDTDAIGGTMTWTQPAANCQKFTYQ